MVRLRTTSIMKFLGRHKNKKGLSLDDSIGYDAGRHRMFDPPSADDRKFLHHASEEAVAAWNSTHAAVTRARCPPATNRSAQLLELLPPPVLERIFAFVCPHARDESYETCERSATEATTCALCDVRDLSHCARVSKRWRASAVRVLYHSIRIDPVHYCDREIYLSERRRKTRFDRNAIPEDAPKVRLSLLARTLRDDPTRLGRIVRFLKLPYMLRESNQADLARTLAVIPGLQYVDLPEGLFSDEHAYTTLRLEVQVRCQDLRKMQYVGGSERSFAMLAQGTTWRNLEVLELKKMNVDPVVLRQVLGVLGNLRALKVTDTRSFTDDVFAYSEMLPPFPPLEEFILTNTPSVTVAGLLEYLTEPAVQESLRVLTLTNTGVQPSTLREVLTNAYALRTFAISGEVAAPLSVADTAVPMSHQFLEVLRYEISAAENAGPFNQAAASHYSFLAGSILSAGFPRLRAVYVRDPTFSEQLQGLVPPPPLATPGHRASASLGIASSGMISSPLAGPPSTPGRARQSYYGGLGGVPPPLPRAAPPPVNNNPFAKKGALTRTLEVFSKDEDGSDWSFVAVQPHPVRGASGGSLSLGHNHSRSLSHSRTPVMSPASPTNGFDSLLAVPGRSQRPVSSYGLGADVTGLGWGTAGARHSVMVGNGTGGFLAVPEGGFAPSGRRGSAASTSAVDEWPRSARKNADLWR